MSTRIEKDSMGEMEVPGDALYGASTARAVKNFPISGQGMGRRFIRAKGMLKKCAALANAELGLLDQGKAEAISKAAQEVADGQWDEHFVVDVFQTGSGTSTNMNANEVIANRAGEILGGDRGSKAVHPNDDVNRGQSSNDTIPTAMQVSALLGISEELIPAIAGLRKTLSAKAQEFSGTVKTGRTHLQDATPITLGQVFQGFSGQLERAERRLKFAVAELSELPLGGTAVGTGVNTHKDFPGKTIALMGKEFSLDLKETDNHFCGQNNTAVAHGVYGSNFELNTMFPVTARNLNQAVDLLSAAVRAFDQSCVQGLVATSAGPDGVERGLMLGTALAPVIGYDLAAKIAKTAAQEGKTIREVALRETELDEYQLSELREPLRMTRPDA